MASVADDRVLDGVMEVMARGFEPEYNEAWTRKQVSDALAMPSGHLITIGRDASDLEPDGNVAGFALSRAAPGEEELLLFSVLPEYRGRGIGMALLEQLKHDASGRGAEKLFLEVRETNPAQNLYRRAGFSPIGRRKEYYRTRYGNRLDAITYACELERRS